MMKKITIVFKLFFLLLFLAISSCAVEDLHEHENSIKAGIQSRKITFTEFKQHQKAFGVMNDVLQEQTRPNGRMNRIIRDSVRNFSIDTQQCLYLEYANLHSFTFPITRPIDNGKIENLVLSYQNDGTYKAKLLIYDLTPQEKLALAADNLQRIQNPIVTVPLLNFNLNVTQAMDCTETTQTIFTSCSGPNGGGCTFANSSGASCEYNVPGSGGIPPRVFTVTRIKCITSATDGNGGGGGGNSGSGQGGGGGGGDGIEYPPEYPTQQTPPEEYESGITKPIKPGLNGPPQIALSPCARIKKIATDTPGLASAITNFKTPAVLNLNYEKGFNIVDNAQNQPQMIPNNGTPSTTFINVIVPEDGSMSALVHSHFDRPDMLPTFTFEDLKTFNAIYQYRKYNNKSLDNLTLLVVSRAGVFALAIENYAAFDMEGYNLWTEQGEILKKEMYGPIKKKNNLTDNDVIAIVAKGLSKFGVGLYQADEGLQNWSKITADADNNITPVPCN